MAASGSRCTRRRRTHVGLRSLGRFLGRFLVQAGKAGDDMFGQSLGAGRTRLMVLDCVVAASVVTTSSAWGRQSQPNSSTPNQAVATPPHAPHAPHVATGRGPAGPSSFPITSGYSTACPPACLPACPPLLSPSVPPAPSFSLSLSHAHAHTSLSSPHPPFSATGPLSSASSSSSPSSSSSSN